MKFYNEIPDCECLAGDTLPAFRVKITGTDTLDGLTVRARLLPVKMPGICKREVLGRREEEGFIVQFTSAHTAGLEGDYWLVIVVTDSAGLVYKKLRGLLTVRSAA